MAAAVFQLPPALWREFFPQICEQGNCNSSLAEIMGDRLALEFIPANPIPTLHFLATVQFRYFK